MEPRTWLPDAAGSMRAPTAAEEPLEEPVQVSQPAPQSLRVEQEEGEEAPNAGADVPDVAPQLIVELSPRPPYPPLALRMGWEGAVICLISVGPDGRVVGVQLETSSGHAALDQAALRGVRRWRFRPGLRNGEPAQMDVRKRVLFQLSS